MTARRHRKDLQRKQRDGLTAQQHFCGVFTFATVSTLNMDRRGLVAPKPTHGSEVGPAAVVSCGDISHVDDLDAAARLRVGAFAAEVSDAAENLLDGGWVFTHDVGGFRYVVTVAGDRKSKQRLDCQNKRGKRKLPFQMSNCLRKRYKAATAYINIQKSVCLFSL